MAKNPCVYIMASAYKGTLYTGVTSNILKRVYAHKKSFNDGFTAKYNCTILVYFKFFTTMYDAISREKQIKKGRRSVKVELIEAMNPNWKDLYPLISI